MWAHEKFYLLCPRVCTTCALILLAVRIYSQWAEKKAESGYAAGIVAVVTACGCTDLGFRHASLQWASGGSEFIIQQEISVSSGAENTLFRRRDNICTCVKRTLCWERSESKGLIHLGGWWGGKNRQLCSVYCFCPPTAHLKCKLQLEGAVHLRQI